MDISVVRQLPIGFMRINCNFCSHGQWKSGFGPDSVEYRVALVGRAIYRSCENKVVCGIRVNFDLIRAEL